MPELPEIEVVKRSLFKMINKAKIIDIKICNKNLRYKLPNTFSRHLIGEKIMAHNECYLFRKMKDFINKSIVVVFTV